VNDPNTLRKTELNKGHGFSCAVRSPQGSGLYRLRKTHVLCQGTTLVGPYEAHRDEDFTGCGKNSCFVSGHDFSRAVTNETMTGFSPLRCCFLARCRVFPQPVSKWLVLNWFGLSC
jgi:hypothetical protein